MQHSLHFQNLTARIATRGAELTSLQDLNTGQEYIWEAAPDIWGSSAPVLFPIVGMLKGGLFLHQGQSYALKRHGLARIRDFELIEDTPASKTFRLCSDPETLADYPFEFELDVRFTLRKQSLHCAYTVRNRGEGAMPFGLGSHPAFALDLSESSLEDYAIEFEEPETLDLYLLEDNLVTEKPERGFLVDEQRLPLSETRFDRDALIFKNIRSRKIAITHKNKGKLLTLDRGPCPHLGIWSKPKAPFVCIEPWHSYSDNPSHNQKLAEKEPILTLESGQSFQSHYTIELG